MNFEPVDRLPIIESYWWWDQTLAGIRIVDIIDPTSTEGPIKVVFERYDAGRPFYYEIGGTDTPGRPALISLYGLRKQEPRQVRMEHRTRTGTTQ